jgi:hypothetical protein
MDLPDAEIRVGTRYRYDQVIGSNNGAGRESSCRSPKCKLPRPCVDHFVRATALRGRAPASRERWADQARGKAVKKA